MAAVFHAAHPQVFPVPPPGVQQQVPTGAQPVHAQQVPVQQLQAPGVAQPGPGGVVPPGVPGMVNMQGLQGAQHQQAPGAGLQGGGGAVGGVTNPSQSYANVAGGNAVGGKGPNLDLDLTGLNLTGIAGIDMSALQQGFENCFWKLWGPVSTDIGRFGEGLRALGEQPDAKPEVLQQLAQYKKLEDGFNTVTDMQLLTFRLFDLLLPSIQGTNEVVRNTNDMVQKNVHSGNLVLDLEGSDKYTNVCDQLTETEVLTKVIDLDMEVPMTSKDAITKKAKAKIGKNKKLENLLKKCKRIEPVARETKPHKTKKDSNDQPMNTIPIKLYSKNKEEKVKLDIALKGAGFVTAFHWPRELVKPMAKVREAYLNFSNDQYDLRDKYLLLRPNTVHGKSINVFFRTKEKDSKFQYLESIKTPASYELCENLGYAQPTVSNFVTFQW